MKTKYQGIASLVIFGLSFLITFGYGVYLANKMTGSIHIPAPASISGIKVPDPATMAYIDFLTPLLADLAILKKSGSDVDLKLFRVNSPHEDNITQTSSINTLEPSREDKANFSYALTLCFASVKNKFCVIDGALYREKGELPDGARLLKIENDRVFILKHNKKEWIYPLQQQDVSNGKNEEAI